MARSKDEPLLSEDLVEFVHGGVAIGVATRDEQLRPAIARGWGPLVADGRRSLSLCVEAPERSPTLANLRANGAIALTASPPTIATGIQLKGTADEVRAPDAGELDRARRQLEAFNAGAESVGVGTGLVRRLYAERDLVLVSCSIDEVFDQTPGPKAGRCL